MSERPIKLFQKERRVFPDPKEESIDGIVAFGIPINTRTLFEAYSFGIFPWPHPDLPMLWYCPEDRGILTFNKLHLSKSLKKKMQKHPYKVTFNTDFKSVIAACADTKRPGQSGTWINQQIIDAYFEFHRSGYAHSVEVWDGNVLIGGLYGVYVGGVFAGESMFYKVSDASKIALVSLIDRLKAQGHSWMDIQMLTPVTERLGGEYVRKNDFLERLEKIKAEKTSKPICFN